MILDCSLNRNGSFAAGNVRSGDVRSPVRNVHRSCRGQPNVSVNPGSGIPARRVLFRSEAHEQNVVGAAEAKMRREVVGEGTVSVWALAQLFVIDPYGGV